MSAQMQPVTVRLSTEMAERLKSLSERSGLDEAILMRRAIEEKVEQWEHDGRIGITLRDAPGTQLTEAQRAALVAAGENPVSYRRERKRGNASNQPPIGGSFGKGLGPGGSPPKEGGSSHRH